MAKDLKELAGIPVSRKVAERIAEAIGEDMERWDKAGRGQLRASEPPPSKAPKTIDTLYVEFDGTGVPMTSPELAGRKGKQPDGTAKTREAKLGCVFTQSVFDEKRRPIRDPASTSFTGAIETAAEFGGRIFAEALRRGLFAAKRVVILSDGAEWIKNMVQTCFPGAIHIIDLYHAREHLIALCKLLFDRDLKRFNGYKDRMRYALFKADGYCVGSGVIEAGCRSAIEEGLNKSGIEWTVGGGNAIIALRCIEASGRSEDYWAQRAA